MTLDSKQIKDNLKIQKYCMLMRERTAIFSLLTSSTDCPINSVHSWSQSRNFVLLSLWLTITSSLYLATHIIVSKWLVNEGHTHWKGVQIPQHNSIIIFATCACERVRLYISFFVALNASWITPWMIIHNKFANRANSNTNNFLVKRT